MKLLKLYRLGLLLNWWHGWWHGGLHDILGLSHFPIVALFKPFQYHENTYGTDVINHYIADIQTISILAHIKGSLKKNPDYLVTLIKRVGGYLAEITTF